MTATHTTPHTSLSTIKRYTCLPAISTDTTQACVHRTDATQKMLHMPPSNMCSWHPTICTQYCQHPQKLTHGTQPVLPIAPNDVYTTQEPPTKTDTWHPALFTNDTQSWLHHTHATQTQIHMPPCTINCWCPNKEVHGTPEAQHQHRLTRQGAITWRRSTAAACSSDVPTVSVAQRASWSRALL